MGVTGSASAAVSQHLRDARVNEHFVAASERGKEYGTKGWGILKSAYASVASQVENVARDNGYRVDLGKRPSLPQWLRRFVARSVLMQTACVQGHPCVCLLKMSCACKNGFREASAPSLTL